MIQKPNPAGRKVRPTIYHNTLQLLTRTDTQQMTFFWQTK